MSVPPCPTAAPCQRITDWASRARKAMCAPVVTRSRPGLLPTVCREKSSRSPRPKRTYLSPSNSPSDSTANPISASAASYIRRLAARSLTRMPTWSMTSLTGRSTRCWSGSSAWTNRSGAADAGAPGAYVRESGLQPQGLRDLHVELVRRRQIARPVAVRRRRPHAGRRGAGQPRDEGRVRAEGGRVARRQRPEVLGHREVLIHHAAAIVEDESHHGPLLQGEQNGDAEAVGQLGAEPPQDIAIERRDPHHGPRATGLDLR